MTPTTEEIDEAKIGGRRRMVPGERLLQAGVLVGRGMKEAVSAANETVPAARDEEVTDEAMTGGLCSPLAHYPQ